jgi:hypothetical protein
MDLNPGQLTALSNLARKQAGEDVNWINISDAQALTELGLAARGREGWTITAEGLAVLKDEPPAAPPSAELHRLR